MYLFRTAVQTPMPGTPHEWHAFSLSWWKFLLGRFPCFLRQPGGGNRLTGILCSQVVFLYNTHHQTPRRGEANQPDWGLGIPIRAELQGLPLPLKIQRIEFCQTNDKVGVNKINPVMTWHCHMCSHKDDINMSDMCWLLMWVGRWSRQSQRLVWQSC